MLFFHFHFSLLSKLGLCVRLCIIILTRDKSTMPRRTKIILVVLLWNRFHQFWSHIYNLSLMVNCVSCKCVCQIVDVLSFFKTILLLLLLMYLVAALLKDQHIKEKKRIHLLIKCLSIRGFIFQSSFFLQNSQPHFCTFFSYHLMANIIYR